MRRTSRQLIFTLLAAVSTVCVWQIADRVIYAQTSTNPGDNGPEPVILLLNSYHLGYMWSDQEQAGLFDTIRKVYPQAEILVEYLDTKYFPDERHIGARKEELREKFSNRKISLIVALDDPALSMTMDMKRGVFKNIPVVFCGVSDQTLLAEAKKAGISGLAEFYDSVRTIELMLKLHTDTKEIYAIHDYTVTGLASRDNLKQQMDRFKDRVAIKFSEKANIQQLVLQVHKVKEGQLVLLLSFASDSTERVMDVDKFTKLISSRTSRPVYGTFEGGLGCGMVGGMLIYGYTHGQQAGKLAVEVIGGRDPATIPIDMSIKGEPKFDYNQLVRFGIPLSSLPEGSTVINKPVSFMEKNFWLVIGIVVAIGGLIGVIFTLSMNIFRRRKAECKLIEARQFAENLIQTANVLVVGLDTQARVFIFNNTAEKVTGYNRRDVIGKNWFELIVPAAEYPQVREVFRQFQEAGNLISTYENPITVKSGEKRIINWSNSPIHEGKKLIGTISFGLDVTERQKTQQEREKLIAELEVRNAELERFTYAMSHDLKSPLITIRGFLGLLRKDMLSGDSRKVDSDVTRMEDATEKMGVLLEDVLKLSRTGRVINPSNKVPLDEVVREAIELVSGLISQKTVAVEIEPGLPIIYADRRRLVEVYQNLLENAVKYMGDQKQPEVRIGQRLDGETHVYYVGDNGIGIEPRYQQKIFGLFDKLDQNSEGSGVGLAITKRIIEAHGGSIWVESDGFGRGATFCFTLADKPAAI